MKGLSTWNHRPFKPHEKCQEVNLPYVCRIAPDAGAFTFQWIDNGFSGEHEVIWEKRSGGGSGSMPLNSWQATISNLEDLTDYVFTVRRVGAEGQVSRLVRTGRIPGDTVINYLHPDDLAYEFSGRFVAGPCIVKCPSGRLVALMDVFSGAEHHAMLCLLYASDDGGLTWNYLNELAPAYWAKLFMHQGALYCIANTNAHGNIVIGRSDDEGVTWTAPTILFPMNYDYGAEGAPGKILIKDGRLCICVGCGTWGRNCFKMGYISAGVDGDLMDPGNWEISELLEYDVNWENSPKNVGRGTQSPGAGIEGNMVLGPDGVLHGCYRMDIRRGGEPNWGKMLMLDADPTQPEKGFTFNAVVDCLLGSNSKFYIDYDAVTGNYVMIGTEQKPPEKPGRTVLSMGISKDLKDWRIVHRIYDYHQYDAGAVGFQYPDWEFDGDDILLVTRVGFNASDTHHNSNCITFERIKNFRQYF